MKVSFGGIRAFADGPSSASVSPGSTFFVVPKVHGSTTAVRHKHISTDQGDITVVLVELCQTP